FYRDNYRHAQSRIAYVLRGGGVERYEPEHTFFGFRYIRLNNWPCAVKLSDFEGVVIHTDAQVRAGFECSDERVNQLMQNILWGQRGNFVDVPTDCPQRDERLGWTGDCQVFARTALTLMDVGPMLSEWLKDLSADQRADGAVPFVVPHALTSEAYGSAAWGDAAAIVPWTLYQCTGDLRTLRHQFPSMKAWVNYISSQSQDYLWTGGFHFGDWLGLDAAEGDYVGATDKVLIATAFYAHSADLTARAAGALGLEKDMQAYKSLHQNIVRAFRREFITPAGRLAMRTQTAYALVLQFDLAEEGHRGRLVHDLVELIAASGDHLTTGFVGTPYLCPVLTAGGRHDVAGKLFLRSEYPSWLYPITKGATTIWEHWDGIKPDGSFWSPDMNSFNHYAYGAIGAWMMRALAGIDMVKPAYAELLLHPRPIEGLSFVSTWQHTACGVVRLSWRDADGVREVGCAVPAGVTALMVLEHARLADVTESDRQLSDAAGVKRAWQSDDDVMMSLQSGEYSFRWPLHA
ncbi:MAG: family 78 glycoside hydrolase catalytic domain, partial [Clostridiales bacterium]|nr:family 78 glycoside hydrolase catalytic domain [Clostridiales bacterium]